MKKTRNHGIPSAGTNTKKFKGFKKSWNPGPAVYIRHGTIGSWAGARDAINDTGKE